MVVLDEVKRGRLAPAGTIELLIATSLQEFRGRARRASLGLAPLAGARHAAGLAVAEAFLCGLLGLRSVSPGLYAFKAKFGPVWEPRYLVVERLTDLVPVLLALFLVHYPGLPRRWWSRGRSILKPS
jgi:phosphatidylglycerol lysyltransferase